MSGFTDSMIDDGFSDPQEYFDYLCSKSLDDDDDYDYPNCYDEEDEVCEDDSFDDEDDDLEE